MWTNPPKKSWQGAEPPLSGNARILGAYGHPTHHLCTVYTSIAALLCKEQVNVSLPACEMQYPCFHWERRCALHPAQQRLRLSSPSVSQISQPAGWTTPLRISLFKRRLNGNKFLDSVWWPFHFPQTSLLRFIL